MIPTDTTSQIVKALTTWGDDLPHVLIEGGPSDTGVAADSIVKALLKVHPKAFVHYTSKGKIAEFHRLAERAAQNTTFDSSLRTLIVAGAHELNPDDIGASLSTLSVVGRRAGCRLIVKTRDAKSLPDNVVGNCIVLEAESGFKIPVS